MKLDMVETIAPGMVKLKFGHCERSAEKLFKYLKPILPGISLESFSKAYDDLKHRIRSDSGYTVVVSKFEFSTEVSITFPIQRNKELERNFVNFIVDKKCSVLMSRFINPKEIFNV